MKTVIEFARQVKLPYDYVTGEPLYLEKLEAFAELVRADALAEQRTWVGLTRDERYLHWPNWISREKWTVLMQKIEQQFKEKNT